MGASSANCRTVHIPRQLHTHRSIETDAEDIDELFNFAANEEETAFKPSELEQVSSSDHTQYTGAAAWTKNINSIFQYLLCL